ncbi:MAG: hypothetical protein U5Q44_12765 [Dehalococcoidia bacterium]|nr:hypothetical protein [Dehalococcoidia bacterium]
MAAAYAPRYNYQFRYVEGLGVLANDVRARVQRATLMLPLLVALAMAACTGGDSDADSPGTARPREVEVVEVASQERTTIGTFEPQAAIQEAGNVAGYELPLATQYDDLQLVAITIQRGPAMGDGEGPITFVQLDYPEGPSRTPTAESK